MKVTVSPSAPAKLLAVFITKESLGRQAKDLERHIAGGGFDAEFDKVLFIPEKIGSAERVLLLGLGPEAEVTAEKIRKMAWYAAAKAQELRLAQIAVVVERIKEYGERDIAAAAVEGLVLGGYKFDKYKTEKKERVVRLEELVIISKVLLAKEEVRKAAQEAADICLNVNMVRDMINEGSDVMNPDKMEDIARQVAKDAYLKIKVLDSKELERLGCGLLLGVGRGSRFAPRLIALEYWGAHKEEKPIALVGKGITFASGGIDLKNATGMMDMKSDMTGAAVVLGTLKTAAELGLHANLVGVLAIAENMIGRNAIKPGEFLRSYSGKTVEILNTDAEGRLVLGDALAWVEKTYEPKLTIDYATLTGAVLIALGEYVTGMVGTADKDIQRLFEAGERTYERVWRLPLYEEYKKEMVSETADLKNIGYPGKYGSYAGTITGAAFLSYFIKGPWIHLDIAGSGWYEKQRYYQPVGGTGIGLRLTIEFLRGLQKGKIKETAK